MQLCESLVVLAKLLSRARRKCLLVLRVPSANICFRPAQQLALTVPSDEAGYFCEPGSSRSNPQACGGAAVYCPAGSGLPLQVVPGNFSTGGTSAASRTGTSVCVSGSNYCPGDGLMYSCPVGVYGNVSGLSSPSCSGPCEAGYFCDTGSTSATQGKCHMRAR